VLANSQPQYIGPVTANASGVFWMAVYSGSNQGGVVAGCVPSGCASGVTTYATIAAGEPALNIGIAADATNVYWPIYSGSSGTVQSCPLNGSCPAGGNTIDSESNGNPNYMVSSGGFVYFTDNFSLSVSPFTAETGTFKCATSGCGTNPTHLAAVPYSDPNGDYFYWPVVDSTNVYWTESNGTVQECAIGGCPSGATVLGSGSMPVGIDSANVYWLSGTSPSASIVKCAIGGCGMSPTPVVSNLTVTTAQLPVLVTSSSIYWMNGATLMKVAK
jgi:hypothetical protein